VLHAAWPLAEPGQIDAALDVLRPYMAELATTGEYDRAVVERVGRWLLIPAITGAVIGVIVETELKRYRLDQDQRDERIDAIRRKLEES
jgi:hypothetical protein